jgi:glycerol-3-phosphate dehydrogenase
MGEDAIDEVARVAGLDERPSRTAELPLHDSDVPELIRLAAERPGWAEPLHLDLPYRVCDVVHAARHEMARTVEDVLARRTRALLLDARASEEAAPAVAALLAAELGRDESWQREQVAAYRELARGYRL